MEGTRRAPGTAGGPREEEAGQVTETAGHQDKTLAKEGLSPNTRLLLSPLYKGFGAHHDPAWAPKKPML